MTQTYPAAGAFWTPFSSGVTPAEEKDLSYQTLKFYTQWRGSPRHDVGVVWRTVEQYWVQGQFQRPAWSAFAEINYQPLPHGDDFIENKTTGLSYRCECCYQAPVIQVARFRAWYLALLQQRPQVELITAWPYPFLNVASHETAAAGTATAGAATAGTATAGAATAGAAAAATACEQAWVDLLRQHDISQLVLCTGTGTHYFRLYDQDKLEQTKIQFRKGVVARVAAQPGPEERVLVYEGGPFATNSLYVVPQDDGYVVGGTVHPTEFDYAARDWEVLPAERAGILERAATYLPEPCQSKLAAAGFWEHRADVAIDWRVGVRPYLEGLGPRVVPAESIAARLEKRLARKLSVYVHFGHGGSGFTFCQDTAAHVAQALGLS